MRLLCFPATSSAGSDIFTLACANFPWHREEFWDAHRPWGHAKKIVIVSGNVYIYR